MNETIVQEEIRCSHCGETCSERDIKKGDLHFCCVGCKNVYELIQVCSLNPDLSVFDHVRQKVNDKYEFLEEIDSTRKLASFWSAKRVVVNLTLPDIHCSSCIWMLENLYELEPGIQRSEINFQKKEITLHFDPKEISLRQVCELLDSLGYPPTLSIASTEEKSKLNSRSLVLKLGIAGFCFGNIMLLSFPHYLGLTFEFAAFQSFFGYISLILSLSVLLYCSSDYFSSAWKSLKKRYINIDVPISIGIITLFVQSTYEAMWKVGNGYFDSLAGLLFFLLIGKWLQSKTYRKLSFDRNYESFFPLNIQLIRNGSAEYVPIQSLKPGDSILVKHQEIIPADGELVNGEAQLDYSFVTGESEVIEAKAGEEVFAGGKNLSTTLKIKVFKSVSQSYLTQLWNHQTFKKEKEGHFQSMIDKISQYFTLVVLSIAAISAAFWWWRGGENIALIFTSVLIVTCPCALALSLPFTLGTATGVLGRNGFFLKNINLIEKMSKIGHIVFDKTGTLTQSGAHQLVWDGETLSEEEKQCIAALTQHSSHPLSAKIFHHLKNDSLPEVSNFQEIAGAGIKGLVKGQTVKIGSAQFIETKGENGQDTQVYVSIDDEVKGSFVFKSEIRKGLIPLLIKIKNHYQVSLLSGDRSHQKEQFQTLFPKDATLKFGQSPHNKLEHIEKLQQVEKVAMIGDGLNDAGALEQSDVGIAVTDDKAYFTPACDAILEGKRLKQLDTFLVFSKKSIQILIASFVLSLLYNIGGIGFAVSGNLTPLVAAILMPLSSISVIAFTTFSIRQVAKTLQLL